MRRAIAWGVVCCLGMVLGDGCARTFAEAGAAQNGVQALDHGWQFRQTPDDGASTAEWLPATVPGDVHLDLLANKRIPDPFYRDNEAKLQWIDQASWEYQLSFEVPASLLARANVDLVFDGLDAAAEVYLNDAHVLSADNMFRVWRVPSKDHLHKATTCCAWCFHRLSRRLKK